MNEFMYFISANSFFILAIYSSLRYYSTREKYLNIFRRNLLQVRIICTKEFANMLSYLYPLKHRNAILMTRNYHKSIAK